VIARGVPSSVAVRDVLDVSVITKEELASVGKAATTVRPIHTQKRRANFSVRFRIVIRPMCTAGPLQLSKVSAI
jgi:hypothetical protein